MIPDRGGKIKMPDLLNEMQERWLLNTDVPFLDKTVSLMISKMIIVNEARMKSGVWEVI
jgi:hypothetical protein